MLLHAQIDQKTSGSHQGHKSWDSRGHLSSCILLHVNKAQHVGPYSLMLSHKIETILEKINPFKDSEAEEKKKKKQQVASPSALGN